MSRLELNPVRFALAFPPINACAYFSKWCLLALLLFDQSVVETDRPTDSH